jgi:hypothetical protein
MADLSSRFPKKKSDTPARSAGGDRFPTNEELLRDLSPYSAKPPPPREIPTISRRTRDYLLLAGLGSVVILVMSFRLMSGSDTWVILRLALTGIGLLCGLLWFIFYGVMSRY